MKLQVLVLCLVLVPPALTFADAPGVHARIGEPCLSQGDRLVLPGRGLDKRVLVVVTGVAANLIAQLAELNELRELVRKAQAAGHRYGAVADHRVGFLRRSGAGLAMGSQLHG